MSKLLPKRYGDRLLVAGDFESPIPVPACCRAALVLAMRAELAVQMLNRQIPPAAL